MEKPLGASILTAAVLSAAGFVLSADEVRIAACTPLSGPQAALGEMLKLGAQLAVEEAQEQFAKSGVKLALSPQDDQASPDVGVAVAKRIVNDASVLGVIGHFNSGVAIPASEVYKDYDLVMVSPANTNPKVTDRLYSNINRVCGRDDVQGPVAAEFAVQELGARNIFVVNDKTAYGQGIAEAFRNKAHELGANIVAFLGTEEKSNFQTLILQLKVHRPDLLYFGGIYDQGGVLVKQIRERGITCTFMGPDGLDSSEFPRIAQEAAKGVFFTTVAGPVDRFPEAAEFARKFEAKFSKRPESFALYSYDAAQVVIQGIRNAMAEVGGAVPSRKAVCKAVRNMSLRGITGLIEFDRKGDRKLADYYVIQLKDGTVPGTTVKVISAASPSK